LIIPYRVDVLPSRRPYANYSIIALTIFVFSLMLSSSLQQLKPYILDGWSVSGLTGYMWLHGGLIHIVFNLIFLWVFGNAVCAKVGNALYVPAFILYGIIAGVAHIIFEGGPAIGASGAIFGVIGTYFVLYPFNSVKCLLWVFIYVRRISVAGLWIILLWVVLNVLGAVTGFTAVTGVAYFAHIGGFVSGFAFGIILLKSKIVVRDDINEALFRHLNT